MAQPRGRRGPGRGRGNSRPAPRGQGYSGRSAPGRQNGGYGGNAGPSSQLPLMLGLGSVAVVLVVVLVLVLGSGGDDGTSGRTGVAGDNNNSGGGGTPATSNRGPRPEPGAPALADVPLTRDQVKEITERIDRISGQYDFSKAKQLVRDGLQAMNSGDNSRAHECWNEADRILHPMVEQANRVFEDYGGLDGVERAIKWARSAKAKADEWEEQRALYLKFLRKD